MISSSTVFVRISRQIFLRVIFAFRSRSGRKFNADAFRIRTSEKFARLDYAMTSVRCARDDGATFSRYRFYLPESESVVIDKRSLTLDE